MARPANPAKVAAVEDVRDAIAGSQGLLLTDFRGLSVQDLAELRAELRKTNATYRVVKNTLTLRAAKDAGVDGLDDYLKGPTALVVCEDDPVGPAKALKAFAKDHEALVVKGGYLDGAVLTDVEAIRLADLESREDVLSGIAGMVNNALATVVNLAMAAQNETARLLAALETDGGAEAKGFAPTAPATAPAEDTAADETVAGETVADDTAVDETVADDTVADAVPADDTAGDETAVDETAVDAAAEDATAAEDSSSSSSDSSDDD